MLTFIKKNKLLSIFILFSFMSFIGGILFYALLDSSFKSIVSNNIVLLFNNELIKMKDYFFNHIFSGVLIWILGISVVGVFLIIFIYLFKTFIFSFEMVALVANASRKNILKIVAYFVPNLFSCCILFILCFYSASYSVFLFKYIFKKSGGNISLITRRYIKILIVTFSLNLLCCLIEYLVFKNMNLLKF